MKRNNLITSRGLRGITMLATGMLGLFLTPACRRNDAQEASKPADASAATKLVICTTFYPTTYFTQRIAEDLVEVECFCPPDADPAFWTPDDQTVARMQKADLIVVNGANFEKGLAKITLPETRIVDTTKPLEDEFIVLEGTTTHSHGPGGSHSHEGVDGHTWLDPINAKIQAEQIRNALAARRPAHAETLERGYAALAQDLDALDVRLKRLSANIGEEMLLCSHPAYNYIARRYGWRLTTYLLDPETMPDDETFATIKANLGEQPARLMLWEAAPTEEIAARFESELAVKSVVFSPCESLEPAEIAAGATFTAEMSENIDRLEPFFDEKPATEGP